MTDDRAFGVRGVGGEAGSAGSRRAAVEADIAATNAVSTIPYLLDVHLPQRTRTSADALPEA
ncbi:hypothetical protein [Dactylosporangium sp. NPDC006015]|uniref:hypothetical protein n=1 Tax=Dactylosporangium sp. NPDC006015 TaxID=3154576 RepID=UPI0033BE7304